MKYLFFIFLILVSLSAIKSQIGISDSGQNTFKSAPASALATGLPRLIVDPPTDGQVFDNKLFFTGSKNVFFVDYDAQNKEVTCVAHQEGTYFSDVEDKNLVTMVYEAHYVWDGVPSIDSLDTDDYTWQARMHNLDRKAIKSKYVKQNADLDNVRFYLRLLNNHDDRGDEFYIFTANALFSSKLELVRGSIPSICDQNSYFPAQPGEVVDIVFGANVWPRKMPNPEVLVVRRNACSAPLRLDFNKFSQDNKLYFPSDPAHYYYCRTDGDSDFPTQCCRNYLEYLNQYSHKISMSHIGDGDFIYGTAPSPSDKCQRGCPAINLDWDPSFVTPSPTAAITTTLAPTTVPFDGTHSTSPADPNTPCMQQLESYPVPQCAHNLYDYDLSSEDFQLFEVEGGDDMVLSLGKILDKQTERYFNLTDDGLSVYAIGFNSTIDIYIGDNDSDNICHYDENDRNTICLNNIMACVPETQLFHLTEDAVVLDSLNRNFDFTDFFSPGTFSDGDGNYINWPNIVAADNTTIEPNFKKNIPVTSASIKYFNAEIPALSTYCPLSEGIQPQDIFEVAVSNSESASVFAAFSNEIIPHRWVTPAIDYNIVEGFCSVKKRDFDFDEPIDVQICDGTSHVALVTYEAPNWTPRVITKSYEDFGLGLSVTPLQWNEMSTAWDRFYNCPANTECEFPYYPVNGCIRSLDTFLNFDQTIAYSLISTLQRDPTTDTNTNLECHSASFHCQNPDQQPCFASSDTSDCAYTHKLWVFDSSTDEKLVSLDIDDVLEELSDNGPVESEWSLYFASGSMDCHGEFTLVLQFIQNGDSTQAMQFIVMYDENFENPDVKPVQLPKGRHSHGGSNFVLLIGGAERFEDSFVVLWQWYSESEGFEDAFTSQYYIK